VLELAFCAECLLGTVLNIESIGRGQCVRAEPLECYQGGPARYPPRLRRRELAAAPFHCQRSWRL